MATLILSSVGTALGGPAGAAIGALIGQSFDQQLLGGGSRGPRLGDLSVQTSSYGSEIPRIYGAMRVAGSVIWATDLSEGTATTGAKGQPDTVYSYSVSFAVAFSSRPVKRVGRIWADGKLIRDADGLFKVPTTVRFHDGSEDQELDPLIASIEGIGSTPAYRGLALAVFENLELVEFGNRIPFITAEIFGDETPPAVGSILNDAGGGLILCDEPRTIAGYAAHGPSIRAALEPLINTLDIQLLDDGVQLRTPSSNLLEIESEHDLGASAREPCPRLERSQVAGSQLPTTVRLSYYDPARDYQIGEARASTSDENRLDARLELPAAIDAEGAKALSQEQLARGWAERDRITVRLPTRYFALRPGMHLNLPIVPARWLVERSAIEDFACVLEARPCWEAIDPIGADSGRLLEHTPAYGETEIALFRAPACFGPSEEPTLLLAASSPGPGWRSEAVEVCVGPHRLIERTARRKSVLGRALNQLAPDGGYLEVELVDPDQWLVSCDDEALASGANFGLLGDELIQFSEAEPVGPGRFRLKGLVRGCRGTEWAEGSHEVRDSFVLVERGTLRPIAVPPWIKASKIAVTVYGGPGSRRLVR